MIERSSSGCSSSINTSRSTARASASVRTSAAGQPAAQLSDHRIGDGRDRGRRSAGCPRPPPRNPRRDHRRREPEQAAAQRILRSGEPAAQSLQPAFGRLDGVDLGPRSPARASGSGPAASGRILVRAVRRRRSERFGASRGMVASSPTAGQSGDVDPAPQAVGAAERDARRRGVAARPVERAAVCSAADRADPPTAVAHQTQDQRGDDDQCGDDRERDPQTFRHPDIVSGSRRRP